MATTLIQLRKSEQKTVLINAIQKWLLKRPFENLDFDEIASDLHMSPRSLRRHLKNHDLCYKELVKSERKKHAVFLIRQNELSLERIGEQLGYRDASSFSRAFKNWYGVSPTEFQRRSDNDEIGRAHV